MVYLVRIKINQLNMLYSIKKITFSILFNSSLLLMLIIGIQNSSNKSKVNLIFNESVKLPVSFIIGISFISGSFLGSCINFSGYSKREN